MKFAQIRHQVSYQDPVPYQRSKWKKFGRNLLPERLCQKNKHLPSFEWFLFGMTLHDVSGHTCRVVPCRAVSCHVMSRKLHDMTSVQRRQCATSLQFTWHDISLEAVVDDMTWHYIAFEETWHDINFWACIVCMTWRHFSQFNKVVDMFIWNC